MKYLFLSLCFFITLSYSAQEKAINYHEGFLYLKLNQQQAPFPGVTNFSDFKKEFPAIAKLVDGFGITEIKCEFKTQDKKVQSIYFVRFNFHNQINELIKELENLSFVEYAEKAAVYQFSAIPDDYNATTQWSLNKIQADLAWNFGVGNAQVKIAVLDAAFMISHQDLQANLWTNTGEIPNNSIDDDGNGYVDDVNGWDAADTDNDVTPPTGSGIDPSFGHGTFVAGVAAGVTNNNVGMASVSHNVSFVPVKVGAGTTSISIPAGIPPLAIDYAIAVNVDFITMSFGAFQESAMGATMQTMVQAAASNNIILLAASGNNSTNDIHYPAKYPEVIAVGATDSLDYKWSNSNYSTDIDIMAPGVDIYSTIDAAPWYQTGWSGTSFSTPMTCATLALMKSNYPQATVTELKQCLFSSADNIDALNSGFVGEIGSGRLNAYNAMQCINNLYLPTSINNYITDNKYVIYPNPTKNYFSINGESIVAVIVYDLSGRIVLQEKQNFKRIAVNQLNKGVYFLTIKTKTEEVKRKLIVQ